MMRRHDLYAPWSEIGDGWVPIVDRLITDRAPWVFTFNFTEPYAVSSRAGNFQYHPQWGPLLDQLWVR